MYLKSITRMAGSGLFLISACFAVAAAAQVPIGQPSYGNEKSAVAARQTPRENPFAQSPSPIADVPPVLPEETRDMHVAPQLLLEHINDARLALGIEDGNLAKTHLNVALDIIRRLKAGIVRNAQGSVMPHDYFPLSGAPASISSQPGNVAESDGNKVYLNLDLDGDKAQKAIAAAVLQANASQYEKAQYTLETLINEMIIQVPASGS